MDESIKIMNLRDTPELIPEAAAWFAAKWGIPREEYEASMRESAESRAPVPQWFAVTDARGKITAGAGIIKNDFHDRKDLSPNLCALFVEEQHRRRGRNNTAAADSRASCSTSRAKPCAAPESPNSTSSPNTHPSTNATAGVTQPTQQATTA